jgi:hypothetical protein
VSSSFFCFLSFPISIYAESLGSGPNRGHVLSKQDIDNLLSWYYTARGRSDNGFPTKEALLRAGLPEVVADFEARELFWAEVQGSFLANL